MTLIRHTLPVFTGSTFIILAACSSPQVATSYQSSPSATTTTSSSQSTGQMIVLAQNMAAAGNHTAAIPIYRQINTEEALQPLSISLIAIGNYTEAENILLSRLNSGFGNWETHYLLGKIYLSNGQFEKANTHYQTASQLNTLDTKVRSGYAISLATIGDIPTAIAVFGAASDPTTLSNKALVHAASGTPDAAVALLEQLVQAGEATPRVRQNLALSYLLQGQEDKAYQMARVDLDAVTLDETFTFYRSLKSLTPAQRMQALVTGAVQPEWNRQEMANLALSDSGAQQTASQRIVEEPKPVVPEPTPEPTPKAEDYELTEVPPLVEPEGWALQIGAYRTIKRLMRGWTILYRKNSDILEGIPPRRSEIDFGENVKDGTPKGFYFRLNAGPLKSLSQAREICKELMARGTECWIRPPEKAEGRLPSKPEDKPKGTNPEDKNDDN